MAMMEAVLFKVFLDSKKAYDALALDWDICLDILAAYGVGPRMLRLLQTYWEWPTMVARASIHYGLPLKGYRGVTQGYPPPPTIFSVVVEAVIRHWVAVVAATEEGMEGLGLLIWDLAEYFYANNGIVASNQPERLQREFEVLTGLLDRVGLRKNTRKTVSMDCQPCHALGRILVEEYERRTTGTRPNFW